MWFQQKLGGKKIILWLLFLAGLCVAIRYCNPISIGVRVTDALTGEERWVFSPSHAEIVLGLCLSVPTCNLLYSALIKPRLGMPWLFLLLFSSYYWGQSLYGIYNNLETPSMILSALAYALTNFAACLAAALLAQILFKGIMRHRKGDAPWNGTKTAAQA